MSDDAVNMLVAARVKGIKSRFEYSTVFTSSGTFNKPTGVDFVYITMIGGGAGGNGSPTTTEPGPGGGAGGIYIRRCVKITGNVSVTIGAAGTAGTFAAPAGGAGGDTTFGSHITAKGGQPTGGGVYQTVYNGSGVIFYPNGCPAPKHSSASNGSAAYNTSGSGCPGQGGYEGKGGTGATGNGSAGTGYGSGGGGGGYAGNTNGGAGTAGICIVEY